MNPYTELGLDPSATPQQIKKAYRKKASAHHPDKGGKPDDFHRAAKAYGILSDPAKRARYDETGDMDMADEWDRMVASEFANLMLTVLERDPADITAAARQVISERRATMTEHRRDTQKELLKNSKRIARVKLLDGGHDPILQALGDRDRHLTEQIRQVEADLKLYVAVSAQLDRYEFTKTETPTPTYAGSTFVFPSHLFNQA